MSDNDQPSTGGAGRWAQLAKVTAQQRAEQSPRRDTAAESSEPAKPTQDYAEPVAATVGTHVDQVDAAAPAAAVPAPTGSVPIEGSALVEPTVPADDGASSISETKRRFFSKTSEPAASAAGPKANPLLPGAPVSGDDNEDGDEERGVLSAGLGHVSGPSDPPVAPAPLNPALPVPTTWPIRRADAGAPSVQLVGLHGGAGTSTLAALIGPEAADCGHSLDELRTVDVPVLFVTRTHARGLDLAMRIGQQHASRTLEPLMVLGVVVVDDAPVLSKGLARTLRSVEKSLPNCWHLPWDEDLRHDTSLPAPASRGRLSRDVRRILKKAEQLVERQSTAPQTHAQNM